MSEDFFFFFQIKEIGFSMCFSSICFCTVSIYSNFSNHFEECACGASSVSENLTLF